MPEMPGVGRVCTHTFITLPFRREEIYLQAMRHSLLQVRYERTNAGSNAICRPTDAAISSYSSNPTPVFLIEVIQEYSDSFECLLLFALNFDGKLNLRLGYSAQISQ